MEGVQDRAAVTAFDADALHVHGGVDDAEHEADEGEGEVQLPGLPGEADGGDGEGDAGAAGAQDRGAAEAGGQQAGEDAADAGDDRDREQHEGELTVGEAELLLQDADLGQQGGEAEALDEVRHGDAESCPAVPHEGPQE